MTSARSTGNRSSNDSRVPPHNIDAERSLLGAAMLSPAALDALVTQTRPGDYYAAAHQHIATAIHRLHLRGDPVDFVTVAEHLRREGELDMIGGQSTINDLVGVVPAISRAGAYAKIVRDAAAARLVIHTATEIADLGYSGLDPAVAFERATTMIAAAGIGTSTDEISTLEIADVRAILAGNLEPEEAQLFLRSDGSGLLYPGKMHTIQAEPSSGKSWLGLYACAEVLAVGGSVVYLDFEDTARGILRRMLNLGASPAHTADRFAYMQPIAGFGVTERRLLWRSVDELNPDLVVIDGVAEALTREGLSENEATDVVKWFELPRALARSGAAVLMLDHVAKDAEGRGRWARGSGAKLGAIDGAVYQLKIGTSFSKHRAGTAKLIIAKDRPGGVGAIGETAALVTVTPAAGGERVTITVDPDTSKHSPTDPYRPTDTMRRVFDQIAATPVPLTAGSISRLVHGKPRIVAEALERLIVEGFISSTGRNRTLAVVKPYTEGSAPPPKRSHYTDTDDPSTMFDPDEYLDDPADDSWIDDAYLESLTRHDQHTGTTIS